MPGQRIPWLPLLSLRSSGSQLVPTYLGLQQQSVGAFPELVANAKWRPVDVQRPAAAAPDSHVSATALRSQALDYYEVC